APSAGHALHGHGQGRRHLSRSGPPDAPVSRCRKGDHLQRPARKARPALILVDSSGWIEYLADRPRASRFASYIEGREPLLVSAIAVYEVYKVIRRDLSEERALEAVSALRRATIVPVDEALAPRGCRHRAVARARDG